MRKDTTIFSELQEFFQQNDAHKAISSNTKHVFPSTNFTHFNPIDIFKTIVSTSSVPAKKDLYSLCS